MTFDVSGTWQMDHDGWTGTLVVQPPDQDFTEVDGNCTYTYAQFSGTWSGGAGQNLAVSGTVGGQDVNRRTGEACPRSPHRVVFTVAFPGAAGQPFEGYVFTREPTRMAGYTWWEGQPFAWSASK